MSEIVKEYLKPTKGIKPLKLGGAVIEKLSFPQFEGVTYRVDVGLRPPDHPPNKPYP